MKKYLYSDWVWFFALFFSYSCYDYWEHISRSGSTFSQYPTDWFLFTFVSATTVGLTMYMGKHAYRLIKIPPMISDLLAFLSGALLHLALTGPVWNATFWPHSELTFLLNYKVVGTLLLGYIFFRIVFILLVSLVKRGIAGG